MKKIVNPCKCKVYDMHSKIIEVPAFVKIEYKEKKPGEKVLSITGVIGPMRNGDCRGSCGQCIDEISDGIPADGWDVDMIKKLCKIWERWHLNDMNAACEHQRAAGWIEKAKIVVKMYKHTTTTEEKALGWLRTEVHPEEILGKECPVCGYKYGSGWLYESVPSDVIDWLFNLPDTKIKPAWV